MNTFFQDNLVIRPKKSDNFHFNKIITFDTETFKFNHAGKEKQIFAIGCFYDGQIPYFVYDINDIDKSINKLLDKFEHITIIAHNFDFDLQISGLLPKVLQPNYLGLKASFRILDKIIYVRFKNKTKSLQFLDSINYFNIKLSTIADMIGFKKKWDLDDYSLSGEEWNNKVKKEGSQAVFEDCRILYKFISQFITTQDFSFGLSLASIAMNTYRKYYLNDFISFPKFLVNEALESYHGGIVLAYILGYDKLHYYDINSLYPYVMKKYKYSYKFHKQIFEYKYLYDDIKNENYNYLLNISYKVKEHSPIFSYYDDKLIPFLENTQWVTGKEYAKLYDLNADIIVHEAFEFFNKDLFSEYIDYFYAKRLTAKTKAESLFYKLILNSLYGKFGQHKARSELKLISSLDKEIEFILIEEGIKKDKERLLIDGITYSIYDDFVSIKKELPVRYNPLIASEITANARLINFEYSEIIKWENLHYTDTDSFMSNKILSSSFIGKELGKLKEEMFTEFKILGNKDYEYLDIETGQWKRVLKGVPANAFIENNIAKYKSFSKIKSHKYNNEIIISNVVKELQRENKKLNYKDNIGYEWKSKQEYDEINAIITK